jgi:hypothetical protein
LFQIASKSNRLSRRPGKSFDWKRITVVICAVFAFTYWTAAHVFLNTSAFRDILDSWEEGILRYEWIVTPLPGVAFVKAAGITHQDKNIRWMVQTNSALILFNPFALLKKKIRFHQVSIARARFRFVVRKLVEGKRPKDALPLSLFPEIPFNKAPKPKKPERDKKEDSDSKWGIQMTGVSIGRLEEAWFNEYHYTGGIEIKGGFKIVPDKSVEVGPATVVFSPGEFLLGTKRLAEHLEGRIQYKMDSFDPDAPDPEILKSVTASLDIQAQAQNLEPLNVYFSSIPWFKLLDGAGKIHLATNVREGKVIGPVKVFFNTNALRVQMGKFLATGTASLVWDVKDGDKPEGTFRGDLHESDITHGGVKILRGGNLSIEGTTPDLEFTSLFNRLSLKVALKKAVAEKLEALNVFLPKSTPVKLENGKAELNLEVATDSLQHGEDRGYFEIQGTGSRVRMKKQVLGGDLKLLLPFEKSKLSKGEFHFRNASLNFSNASLLQGGDQRSWWAQVKIPKASLIAEPTTIRSEFQVLMKNSLPLVPLVTGVTHGETVLTRLISVENIQAKGRFYVSPSGFEVTGLHFDSSNLKIDGYYKEDSDLASARMLVVMQPFAVGLSIIQGETRLILNDAFKWYKAGVTTADQIETQPIAD